MFVCVYVCLFAYLKNRTSKLYGNVLYVLPVAVAQSFFHDSTILYVFPLFQFCGCYFFT